MAEELTSAKKNGSQNFRIHTASTKVTQSELAELERAAAERGIRLSEWIREVLFRELRDSDQITFSHVTGRVAGRRTIRGNHAAGEGKETSLGSTDFGGATTRYTRIKTNRDHSLYSVSVAEARSVSRLCDRSAADVVRP